MGNIPGHGQAPSRPEPTRGRPNRRLPNPCDDRVGWDSARPSSDIAVAAQEQPAFGAVAAETESTILDDDGAVPALTAMGEYSDVGSSRGDPKRHAEDAENGQAIQTRLRPGSRWNSAGVRSPAGQEATFHTSAAGPPGDTAVVGEDYSPVGDAATGAGVRRSATRRAPRYGPRNGRSHGACLRGRTGRMAQRERKPPRLGRGELIGRHPTRAIPLARREVIAIDSCPCRNRKRHPVCGSGALAPRVSRSRPMGLNE